MLYLRVSLWTWLYHVRAELSANFKKFRNRIYDTLVSAICHIIFDTGKNYCQKWDSNPRPQKWTATWTHRLRPLGHPDLLRKRSSCIKVEPYSIHGSFLKPEYQKTEFNEDNGTYAIVKVASHSCRIMVNLSISDYFEVMWHRVLADIWKQGVQIEVS